MKQRFIRVILPCNGEATLCSRYITLQLRGNIAFALITRCNDKTTLHSRYDTLQRQENVAFAL